MPTIKVTYTPPSYKMIDYMNILFNDCGFDRTTRNAYLTARFHRIIKYLDDLRYYEAVEVIKTLKGQRGDKS